MPQAAERLKGDKALLMQRIDRLIIDLEQILVDRAVQELLDLLVVVKAVLFLRSFCDLSPAGCVLREIRDIPHNPAQDRPFPAFLRPPRRTG